MLPTVKHPRLLAFAGFVMGLSLAFLNTLISLAGFAWKRDEHSYIMLVPLVSIWLVWTKRHKIQWSCATSLLPGLAFALTAAGAICLAWTWGNTNAGQENCLLIMSAAYVSSILAGAFFLLGWPVIRQIVFPVFFLIFLIPMPQVMVDFLESQLQHASAWAAALMFTLSGQTFLQEDMIFRLPGLTITVAPECSGIRSTLVLFITSLVASHLLLQRPVSRALLVLSIIPIGIIRNGLRIFTISMLTVHINPETINSSLHHNGGPLFFALSLIPLFAWLWFLHRRDRLSRS